MPGTVLVAEGGRPRALFVTLNGAVEEAIRRGVRAIRVALAGPGRGFGYASLLGATGRRRRRSRGSDRSCSRSTRRSSTRCSPTTRSRAPSSATSSPRCARPSGRRRVSQPRSEPHARLCARAAVEGARPPGPTSTGSSTRSGTRSTRRTCACARTRPTSAARRRPSSRSSPASSAATGHEKAGARGEPFDIAHEAWAADSPDPSNFLNVLLDGRRIQPTNNVNIAYFNDAGYQRKLDAATRRSGSRPTAGSTPTSWPTVRRERRTSRSTRGSSSRRASGASRPIGLRHDEPRRGLQEVALRPARGAPRGAPRVSVACCAARRGARPAR